MPKMSDVIIAQLISSLTEFLVVVSTLGTAKSLNSVPSSKGCPWYKPTFPAVSLYLCQAAVAPRYKQPAGTRLEYHDGARDGSPQLLCGECATCGRCLIHLPEGAIVRRMRAAPFSMNANTLLFCPGRVNEFQDGYQDLGMAMHNDCGEQHMFWGHRSTYINTNEAGNMLKLAHPYIFTSSRQDEVLSSYIGTACCG